MGKYGLLSLKKFVIVLMISTLVFTVTDEFVYATSEYQNPDTNLTYNMSLEMVNNIKDQSNVLETLDNVWVKPIIQIQNTIGTGLIFAQNNSNKGNNINKSNKTSSNSNLNEQEVNTEFQNIQSRPYNEKSMNCQVKSKLFAEYLYNSGAKQIDIVVIEHDTGDYSHEFVEWNGHYYDACNNNELSYKLSEQDYLEQLNQLGFTGLIITSPYPN